MTVNAEKHYLCYVIASHDFRCTYVGMTNNLLRRLRQHDRIIKGGAKATCGFAPCRLLFVVRGFGTDKRATLRAEWRLKEHRNWRVSKATNVLHKRQLLLDKMLGWADGCLKQKLEIVYGLPFGGSTESALCGRLCSDTRGCTNF